MKTRSALIPMLAIFTLMTLVGPFAMAQGHTSETMLGIVNDALSGPSFSQLKLLNELDETRLAKIYAEEVDGEKGEIAIEVVATRIENRQHMDVTIDEIMKAESAKKVSTAQDLKRDMEYMFKTIYYFNDLGTRYQAADSALALYDNTGEVALVKSYVETYILKTR